METSNYPWNLSSKIKTIFIELHNYSFFHNPSETGNVDERFIGRGRIIQKLKALLTNSETRSGTYLVTGYRGMGKSSFVSKVLNDINAHQRLSRRSSRYFRIFFPLILFAIFDTMPYGLAKIPATTIQFFWLIPMSAILYLFSYLLRTDRKMHDLWRDDEEESLVRYQYISLSFLFALFILGTFYALFIQVVPELKEYLFHVGYLLHLIVLFIALMTVIYNYFLVDKSGKRSRRAELWHSLLRSFFIEKEVAAKFRFRMFVQDIYLVLFIHILASIFIGVWSHHEETNIQFKIRFLTYIVMFLFLFAVNHIASFTIRRGESRRESHSLREPIRLFLGFFNHLKSSIKSYVNYSTQIHVRINLGHDNLKEIDILRLVVRSIASRYEERVTSFEFPEISWKIIKFVSILVILGTVYYYTSLNQIGQSLKKDFGMIHFFPSQGWFLLESDTTLSNILSNANLFREERYILDSSISFSLDILQYHHPLDSFAREHIPSDLRLRGQWASGHIKEKLVGGLGVKTFHHRFLLQSDTTELWQAFHTITSIAPSVYSGPSNRPIFDSSSHPRKTYVDSLMRFAQGIKKLTSAIKSDSIPTIVLEIGNIHESPFTLESYLDSLRNHIRDSSADNKYFSAPEKGGVIGTIRRVTTYSDVIIQAIYLKILRSFPLREQWFFPGLNDRFSTHTYIRVSEDFRIIPLQIDYLFWFCFITTWYFVKFVFSFRPFGIISHRYVIRELNELNELIDAQVTQEDQGEISQTAMRSTFRLGLLRRKQRVYPRADEREIEKRLREILDAISRIPRITRRPEFIFIFDELDKIEPRGRRSTDDPAQSSSSPESDSAEPFFTSEGVRERQHNIFKLLSNLKHFLTTAKAKFIFIAGREMFDAALADVSDRNFFVGSVFNEVIYVDSFLKDPSNVISGEITRMTEQYVCQFLLPENYPRDECNLETYNKYLMSRYHHVRTRLKSLPDCMSEPDLIKRHLRYEKQTGHLLLVDTFSQEVFEDENVKIACKENPLFKKALERLRTESLDAYHCAREREKIVATLYNFIVYLTYRSNGTPKKITTYFEQYITATDQQTLRNRDENLCVGINSNSLFLRFGFYAQYTFGLDAYLISPLFASINRSIQDYGDKLLVSSSFLIDHIYKFHKIGFGWRNLELMPEVVDINKSPQLRELITRVLRFIGNTHIKVIDNGLYNFKFRKKIEEEIALLSKINEREAAAFNFAFDESLSTKQRYFKKLRELEKVYKPYFGSGKGFSFIRSISFIHMILGDLYFFDEEYDNAILEYMEAVQLFGENKFEELQVEIQVLLIRNYLKLGLAFEKKKTYDSAFLTFGKLASRLTDFRNIDPKKHLDDKKIEGIEETLKYIHDDPFGVDKEYLLFRFDMLRGLRLMYQPFIAKFQLIEKSTIIGITLDDLTRIERELEFLIDLTLPEDKKESFVIADYKARIGDVLFFKNGLMKYNKPVKRFKDRNKIYCWRDDAFCTKNEYLDDELLGRGLRVPCGACRFYHESLSILCKDYLQLTPKSGSIILDLLRYLNRGDFSEKGENARKDRILEKTGTNELQQSLDKNEAVMQTAASVFSEIGDTYLSCATIKHHLSSDFLKTFAEMIQCDSVLGKCDILKTYKGPFTKIEETIMFYYLSAAYYRRSSDHSQYAFQLTKILQVFREYIRQRKSDIVTWSAEYKSQIMSISSTMACKAIHGHYITFEHTHMLELSKLQGVFNNNSFVDYKNHVSRDTLEHSSLSWEVREVELLTNEIRFFLTSSDIETLLRQRCQGHCSPVSLVNSMYDRVLQLQWQVILNYNMAHQLGLINKNESGPPSLTTKILTKEEKTLLDKFGFPEDEQLLIEFLICDSLFCLSEIVERCKMLGISYIVSHTFLSAAHFKLGDWCSLYQEIVKDKERSTRIQQIVTRLLGPENRAKLIPNYHYEESLHHFRWARDTHREGRAYKNMIEDMVYLNGDFNDTLFHFCAALERYAINGERMKKKTDFLRKVVGESKLYDVNSYISEGSTPDRG